MQTINLTTYCSQNSGDIKFIFIKEDDDESQSNMEKVIAVS